jgi:hypothetical protein
MSKKVATHKRRSVGMADIMGYTLLRTDKEFTQLLV